jgi:hypothetical protein
MNEVRMEFKRERERTIGLMNYGSNYLHFDLDSAPQITARLARSLSMKEMTLTKTKSARRRSSQAIVFSTSNRFLA